MEKENRVIDNSSAFRKILANRDMLMSYAYAVVRDHELAEDIFQDTFLEIVRTWRSYDTSKPFGCWARGVLRNVAFNSLRKRNRRIVIFNNDVLEIVGAGLEQVVAGGSLDSRNRALRDCVKRLPKKQREMVRMRYIDNMSHIDVAESLSITENALYAALSRMYKTLRKCVRGRIAEGGGINAE